MTLEQLVSKLSPHYLVTITDQHFVGLIFDFPLVGRVEFINCTFSACEFRRVTTGDAIFRECKFVGASYFTKSFIGRGTFNLCDMGDTDFYGYVSSNPFSKGCKIGRIRVQANVNRTMILAYSHKRNDVAPYVLFQLGNRYFAGCRNFTKARAIKYWSTKSKRPTFVKALQK